MVSEIRIYFEGDRRLRPGLEAFLKPAIDLARERRVRFKAVAGGSTDETIKDFLDGVQDYPGALIILLVDSDRRDDGNLVAAVKSRSSWNTRLGAAVHEEQIHSMVQVMESWFLADKSAVERYYGNRFQSNRLPQDLNVEQIPKDDVIRGLEGATRNTSKKKYHKTRHATALLQAIDPAKVRNAAPNCDRLFVALNRLTTST